VYFENGQVIVEFLYSGIPISYTFNYYAY